LDTLIAHGLRALRDTLQQDKELSQENTSIGIVGIDHPFEIIEDSGLDKYLDVLKVQISNGLVISG
jgi:20S proteasome subunit alpha 6